MMVGQSRGSSKWWDYTYMLKVEPTGFAHGSDKHKRGVKITPRLLAWAPGRREDGEDITKKGNSVLVVSAASMKVSG